MHRQVRLDAQTGKLIEEIASNDKCNCGGVLLDDDTKEVRAVSFNYARTERTFFDAELEKDFKKLEAAGAAGSEVTISSRTRDDQTVRPATAPTRDQPKTSRPRPRSATHALGLPAPVQWVVMYRRDDGPSEYVLYDRTSGKSDPLFVSQPSLLEYKFAHMEDVRIPARDGLELVAYLTRAQTDKPTPMVLLVHGGPWARDFWGFNSAAQWLANRGYAVLQGNYRGSAAGVDTAS